MHSEARTARIGSTFQVSHAATKASVVLRMLVVNLVDILGGWRVRIGVSAFNSSGLILRMGWGELG